nr:G protein-coupled receptor [Proales similis]
MLNIFLNSNISINQYWTQFEPAQRKWHELFAFLYGTVFVLGLSANLLVLFYLVKTRRFQNHSSYFIVNLVVADIFKVLINAPMNVASSLAGRWLFGQLGCDVYGVAGGLFGFLNIATMLCMSIERFLVVRDPLIVLKMKSKYVLGSIAFCWVYAAASIAPQLLSPNRFVLEGFLTSCSFDYISQDLTTRVYMLAMFAAGFLIPLCGIIIFGCSMIFMLRRNQSFKSYILADSQRSTEVSMFYVKKRFGHNRSLPNQFDFSDSYRSLGSLQADRGSTFSASNVSSRKMFDSFLKRELKVAKTVFMIVMTFCIAWTPYALVTLLAQFSENRYSYITPWTTAFPSLFAKTSSIFNPIVYSLTNTECRRFFKSLFLSCRFIPRRNNSHPNDLL